MNKKGFTLIELLAVIVVLSIILAIAVANITGIIDNARIDTFKANEKLLIRAAKNYYAYNSTLLPTNIGDSTEISVQNLKINNYITAIYDPADKSIECGGYVVVTKTGNTEYQYNPSLKCGDANAISASTGDGLIAHYTFDDFQEPTTNLVPNPSFESGNTNGWSFGNATNGSNSIDSDNGIFGSKSIKIKVSNGGDQYQFTSYNFGASLSGRTFTVSAYIKTDQIVGQGVSIATYWVDSTGNWIWVNNVRSSYVTGTTDWTRLTATGVAPANAYRATIIIGPTYPANGQGSYWIDGVQIEEKDHATTYTDISRTGVIKDYSGHGYSATLDITKTPKWVNTGINSSGAYQFAKSTDVISVTGALTGAYTAQKYSWGAWVKLNTGYNTNGRVLMSQINTLELTVVPSRIAYATTRDALGYNNTSGSTALATDRWYYLFVTCDGVTTKQYVDGALVSQINSSGFNSTSNDIFIGNWSAGQVFTGIIDEVVTYNRALSTSEVKYLYYENK